MRIAGPVDGNRLPAGPAPSFHAFWRSYVRALCANAGMLAAACATGWIVAATRGVELPVEPPRAAASDIYWFLVGNNSRVLIALVAGAFTFGIYSAIVLVWNGYFLGVGLSSLARGAPDLLLPAAPHVTLEFTALLLAASAGWVLLGDCVGCLAGNRPVRIHGIAAAVAAAFFLVLVAAWFEVRLLDGDFSLWDILCG